MRGGERLSDHSRSQKSRLQGLRRGIASRSLPYPLLRGIRSPGCDCNRGIKLEAGLDTCVSAWARDVRNGNVQNGFADSEPSPPGNRNGSGDTGGSRRAFGCVCRRYPERGLPSTGSRDHGAGPGGAPRCARSMGGGGKSTTRTGGGRVTKALARVPVSAPAARCGGAAPADFVEHEVYCALSVWNLRRSL